MSDNIIKYLDLFATLNEMVDYIPNPTMCFYQKKFTFISDLFVTIVKKWKN